MFRSVSENKKKKKLFLLNCFSGHVECSFDNPVEQTLTEGRKIFPESPKNFKKIKLSQKKMFLKMF